MKSRAQLAAKVNKIHEPAHTKAAQVDDAAVSPPEETQGQANARHMDDLAQQKPAPFDKGAFKATVRQKIVDAAPKNLEQADNFKSDNKLGDVKKQAASDVKQSSEQSAGPIQKKNQETPSTSGLRQKSVKPLAPEAPSGPASNLGARGAAPKPRKEAEISLQAGPQQIQKQMADHQVTESQLQRSNEPTFLAAVDARQAAQKDADAGPAKFRPVEQGALAAAGAGAEAMAMQATQTMKGGRDAATRQVLSQQDMAKGKDEQSRSQVATKIQSIFDDTKQAVQNRLTKLDSDVNDAFDKGADAARKDFEDYVGKRMDAYKDDRYSGVFGWAKWVWDKLAGMPDEVNVFYEEGRDRFLHAMDATLDQVATLVEVGLSEATALVASGRKQVQSYVDSLPQSLHQIGQDAQSSIEDQFQSLEQSIQDKQDELVDGLAQKYNDQVKQLDDRIDELKEENKGLVQKAIEFIVDVVKTLVEMGALLVKILIRAAGVVWKILKDPIGFLRNLISGAKNGLDRFTKNIAKHLQRGLVQWLTGELGGVGLQLPDTFDAKGVFTLVLQVLGLSYEGIRARLVRHFGEGTAQAVEEGVDIIKKAKEGGVGALWEEIKDHLGNLKDQVLGDIQQYVQTQVIQAGVMWVVSLFNPASAFVQACRAIYRIVQFFVEKAAQIATLVDAVLDSVEAVASGDVGAMASKIEDALAKAIPVVIGLLASLLGISGIAQKVKSILHKVRAPIEKAIDAVLKKAAGLVKQARKRIGDKGAGSDKQTASGTDHGAGTADMVDTETDTRMKVGAKDENGSKPRSEVEVPKRLVFPHSETPISLAPAIQKQLATGPKSVVVHEGGSDPKEATRRVLTEHKDAEYDSRRGQLTLPSLHEAGLATAQTMEQLGALVAAQTGVQKVTLLYKGNKAYIKVQINPPALQEVQLSPSVKRKFATTEPSQQPAGKKPAKRRKRNKSDRPKDPRFKQDDGLPLSHQAKYGPTKGLNPMGEEGRGEQRLLEHYGADKNQNPLVRQTQYAKEHSTYVQSAEQTGRPLTEQEQAAKSSGHNAADASINHIIASGTGQNHMNRATLQFLRGQDVMTAGWGQEAERDSKAVAKALADQAAAVARMQGMGREILKERLGEPGFSTEQEVLQKRNALLRQAIIPAFQGSSPAKPWEGYRGYLKQTFDSPGNLRVGDARANIRVSTAVDMELDKSGHATARSQRLLSAYHQYGEDDLLSDENMWTRDESGQILSSSKEG